MTDDMGDTAKSIVTLLCGKLPFMAGVSFTPEVSRVLNSKKVSDQALPADNYTLLYEHGERVQPAGQYLDGNPDPQLGKFERFEAQPNDPEALHFLM